MTEHHESLALVERWLHLQIASVGFSEAFAEEHANALACTIRTLPEDLDKMRADLSVLAGA